VGGLDGCPVCCSCRSCGRPLRSGCLASGGRCLRSRGVRARDESNDLDRAPSAGDALVQKQELLAGGLVHGVHPHERAPVDSEVRMGSEGSESLDRIEAPRGSLTNRKRRIDR